MVDQRVQMVIEDPWLLKLRCMSAMVNDDQIDVREPSAGSLRVLQGDDGILTAVNQERGDVTGRQ